MRVVHLGTGVIPVPPGQIAGGIEEYIYRLTDALGKTGCEVDVIDIKSGEEQKQKRRESSAAFHEVWHPPLPPRRRFPFGQRFFNYLLVMSQVTIFVVQASFTLYKLLGKKQVDIIQAHTREPALAAILVNKLRRSRAVVIFDTHAALIMEDLGWFMRLITSPELLAIHRADHIIPDTPAVKKRLVTKYRIDPEKMTPIYTGLPLEEIEQFLRGKTGQRQAGLVLSVGTVDSRKNQSTTVKTVPKVIARNPYVKYIFAGHIADTGYFKTIQDFIKENSLQPYVEFKGMVSRQELYDLYSRASLFVFPSAAESRGDVVAEALSFGLPVIASDIEPIADLIGQSQCALLFKPFDVDGIADAISMLLEDALRRQSMSRQAKELVKSLSWDNIAGQNIALYNRLIAKKRNILHSPN
jgi:glycogen synthase